MSVARYDYLYSSIDGELHREELSDGRYVLHDDYAALLARHNALWNFYEQLENAMYEFEKEARIERMKRVAAEIFTARHKEIAASAIEQNNALREAVEWERECYLFCKTAEWMYWNKIPCAYWHLRAARAEVDRLLGER